MAKNPPVTAKTPSKEEEQRLQKRRRYIALFSALLLLAGVLIVRSGCSGSDLVTRLGQAYEQAREHAARGEYTDALTMLNEAYTYLDDMMATIDDVDPDTRERILRLKQQMDQDKALWELQSRPDGRIQELIEQADDDAALGFYQRALDKLDEARDLLRDLKRDMYSLPEEQREQLEPIVEELEDAIRERRLQLAQAIRREQQQGQTTPDPAISRELERLRLERERNRLELEKARAQQEQSRPTDRTQPSETTQPESTQTQTTPSGTTSPGPAPTQTRDVQTESMNKVDIDLGEDIEMD